MISIDSEENVKILWNYGAFDNFLSFDKSKLDTFTPLHKSQCFLQF